MGSQITRKTIGRRAAVCIAAAVAIAASCIALANCAAEPDLPDEGAPASASAAASPPEEPLEPEPEAPEDESPAESNVVSGGGSQSEPTAALSGETTSQDVASDVPGGNSQPSSAAAEAPSTTAPAAPGGESQNQPAWVVDYSDVWVEDSPAWDESVPVYGSVEVSIRNVCGADVTGNASAHGKQHMLAGEGSGHHSEVSEAVVGYEAVHHDAAGHWERVESGGHWE